MDMQPSPADNSYNQFVSNIGRKVLDFIDRVGKLSFLVWQVIKTLRWIYRDRKLYFRQAMEIGVMSLPLVLLIGAFTGAVSTWQTNYTAGDLLPLKYLGMATFKAVIIELGPVLSGLVLAGRVGSSLSAELATMRISEQVDALEVLAVDPIRYLVSPRMIAAIIMVPVLVTLAVFTAMWGGFLVANLFMGVGFDLYFGEIPVFFKMKDVYVMLAKSATFGGIIALTGTYVGMNAKGGAEGVGKATIRSFVYSALGILVMDYFLVVILF